MIRTAHRPRDGGRSRGPGPASGRSAAALLLVLLSLAAAPAARGQPAGAFSAAFDAALANNAEYRASRYELQGREQAVPIARAGLLPNLTASYSESRVRGEREQLNTFGQEFTQRLDYRNPLGALRFRTPLVDFEALRRYEASQAQLDGARAQFEASGQQLLDRLGTAYLQRLFGEALVALAHAQVEAFRAQSDAAARRFGGGEGTRTDVAEAAAALALARAQLVEATDQRDVSQRTLARITGLPSPPLRDLADDTRPLPMPYDNVDDWIQAAYARNPDLQARAHLLEAARIEIKRNQAGHLPRLELVASAVNSQSESISTLNQQVHQYAAGIQLNIPIFAGGSVEAGVARAEAEALRVESQLEADRLALAVDIRRQFQFTQTGLAKIAAYKDAIAASVVALEGNQRGLAAGLRTTVDVNEATRRLFVSRRDFAQARYEVLLARLRLQTLAGLPLTDIVQDIDRHLTAPTVGLTTPAQDLPTQLEAHPR